MLFSPAHVNYSPPKAICLPPGKNGFPWVPPHLIERRKFSPMNSHDLLKFCVHSHWKASVKHSQDSGVLFSFWKMLMLFLCLLSKILSQWRQAEFPLWVISIFLWVVNQGSFQFWQYKLILKKKRKAFVLPICYFPEVLKLSYFNSLRKPFILFFPPPPFFFNHVNSTDSFSALFHHPSGSVSQPKALRVMVDCCFFSGTVKQGSTVPKYWGKYRGPGWSS